MTGELNIPFEPVPDGPFDFELTAVQCGGLVFRAARADLGDGQTIPVVIFDFRQITGEQIAPIALYLPPDDMLHLRAQLTSAIDAAIGAAS